MLLLDSLYINNGGGKILLNYLVEKMEQKNMDVFYLFDERCRNDFSDIPNNRKLYLKASLWNRHKFYLKNGKKFSRIFCFGNLAPTIKLKAKTYTYFHQSIFLNIPKEFSLKKRLLFKLKTKIFKALLRNTTFLVVQNQITKNCLNEKFSFKLDNILLFPFYRNEDLKISNNKKPNTFIYVSSGSPHKNHIRLINAFCSFFDKNKKGELILTIPDNEKELLGIVRLKIEEGYPLNNIGFVNRSTLVDFYHTSEYLIFPSLEESFGLGIVEAIDCECKVIGADLPYMHQVCSPSILFNPFDEKDISRAFEDALNKEEGMTVKKIDNKINQLIELLK